MTTYCHIGMGRLGIAVANAMMLLQKGYFCPECTHRLTAQRRRDAGAFL